jgi:hypothetical protein
MMRASVLFAILMFCAFGCVSVVKHPCLDGGQPAHDDGKPGKGTKQCIQQKDSTGHFVNHGKYIEWYPNGKRSLEGEFVSGVKEGKWTEWDEQGRKIGDKWYEKGEVVPGREAQPYNGIGKAPRATPTPTSAAELNTSTRSKSASTSH